MNSKNNFMLRAIELSINSVNTAGGPFGCVIVKENKIIAEGSNKVTSSNDPTAHAEVVAIREACKKLNTFNLTGCDLYTSCEPCPMCLSAIYWSHIDNIFYANTRDDAKKINFDDSLIYSEISKKNEDRKIPIKQMLRDEALKAFELWDKKMKSVKKSVLPEINKAVIFRTDAESNHGFPDPIRCPENVTRKSIALYYYTKEKTILPLTVRRRKYFHAVWKKRPNVDEPKFGDNDSFFKRLK